MAARSFDCMIGFLLTYNILAYKCTTHGIYRRVSFPDDRSDYKLRLSFYLCAATHLQHETKFPVAPTAAAYKLRFTFKVPAAHILVKLTLLTNAGRETAM